jgi:hypothetical protein
MSRALSWVDRGTLRADVFGQHWTLKAQASESVTGAIELSRYRAIRGAKKG